MCGRIACTLAPEELCMACTAKNDFGFYSKVDWFFSGLDYKPSFNIPPSRACPVLTLKRNIDPKCNTAERVVTPMHWGFIPKQHKGTPNNHGISSHNCCSERVLNSPLYSPALLSGQRCVVLCNGFYEWQQNASTKQPYFVYLPQPEGVQWHEPSQWKASWDFNIGWQGPRLLLMAGIFHTWISPEGKSIPNFTVLTKYSKGSKMAKIHDRMPVILDSEDKVNIWLGTKYESPEEALEIVAKPVDVNVMMHEVSPTMGSVAVNSLLCVKPFQKGNPMMDAWLKKGKQESKSLSSSTKKRAHSDDEDQDQDKKLKDEAADEATKNSLRVFLP